MNDGEKKSTTLTISVPVGVRLAAPSVFLMKKMPLLQLKVLKFI